LRLAETTNYTEPVYRGKIGKSVKEEVDPLLPDIGPSDKEKAWVRGDGWQGVCWGDAIGECEDWGGYSPVSKKTFVGRGQDMYC
jgi:hypothetical protein